MELYFNFDLNNNVLLKEHTAKEFKTNIEFLRLIFYRIAPWRGLQARTRSEDTTEGGSSGWDPSICGGLV